MSLAVFFQWLQNTPVGTAVRENPVLFPLIESTHVLVLTFLIGSIAMVDLRLLGVSSRKYAVTRLTAELLPWTWGAFALAAITGGLLFASAAVKYSQNFPFQLKMILLALAGVNMLVFHLVTERSIEHWDEHPSPPLAAKIAGGFSLLLWIGVVAAGRMIGFTTQSSPFG